MRRGRKLSPGAGGERVGVRLLGVGCVVLCVVVSCCSLVVSCGGLAFSNTHVHKAVELLRERTERHLACVCGGGVVGGSS